MKIYQIFGMRRSGNHAIINWLIENMSDDGSDRTYVDNISFSSKDVSFVNQVMDGSVPNTFDRHKKYSLRYCLKQVTSVQPKNLILSYEETSLDESNYFNVLENSPHTKIVIIRNLENVVASRIQHTIQHGAAPQDDAFFKAWESHARSPFLKIHYDKWLVDKDYRNSICDQLDIINKDITDIVSSAGNGSSFIGQSLDSSSNLLSRFKQVQFSEEILNKILYYGQRNPEYCKFKESEV